MISDKSIIYKMTKKLETFMYKKADQIICVSGKMYNYICQYTNKERIHVIYNGVSEKDIHIIPTIKESEGIAVNKAKRTIFYAGNIGRAQKLDVLIKAFNIDKSLKNRFDFHVIGDGAFRDKLLTEAKKDGVNIQYYGSMPKDETIRSVKKTADILFLALEKKESFEKTIPSKVFDYLSKQAHCIWYRR